MKVKSMFSPEETKSALSAIERQFILMRSNGSSIRDIAKKLKKSTHTICNWNKKFSKELLDARNNIFCELQKKIIDSKTSRLDFLRSEINRVSKILSKEKVIESGFGSNYDKILNYYARLSDLMSSFEIDLLKVGVDFRNNIEPESNLPEKEDENSAVACLRQVAENNNNVTENVSKENTKNQELKKVNNKTATNCNTTTLPKKYSFKKQ
jgi:transposase